MDRLSNTKSNVSATYGRRLNKSYYEPFQGFAYCILMINIVDMKKKKKEIKIAGSLTLALTGSGYLSKLQHFITSTAGFELTLRPHSPLMVWACPLVELIATNPPQQFTKSHKKHWTVSRGVQKKPKQKPVMVLLSGGFFMCSVSERMKNKNEDKSKSFNSSHIVKKIKLKK